MEQMAYGDRGVLLFALKEAERARLIAAFEDLLPAGCSEFVIGHDSILLVGPSLLSAPGQIEKHCAEVLKGRTSKSTKPRRHEITVRYNGADLEAVAKATHLSIEEVIEIHSAPIYVVRMMGFSPGFPYLEGLDTRLHLDRRSSPRNRIEPGSIAIGGSHAGIYSVASPGGWHLLGQTDFKLFDPDAAVRTVPYAREVFALSVGDEIQFIPSESC